MMADLRDDADRAAAEALVVRIRGEIPLTGAMAIALAHYDGHSLGLRVPLAPNINDKGTAFAGSITSLGCITGWSLLTLWSAREIGPCQVAIYDARFSFRQPLRGDFTASVAMPPPEECKALRHALTRRGKGRITLAVTLSDDDGVAAVLEGGYAIWKAAPAS